MTETLDLLIEKIELYLQNAVISFGLLKGYLQGGARTARPQQANNGGKTTYFLEENGVILNSIIKENSDLKRLSKQ